MMETQAIDNALSNYQRMQATERAWALHTMLGSWGAVAKAMTPYLKLSRTAWWHVGKGKKITPEKYAALLHWPEIPASAHVPREHPRHKSLNIRRSTWEYANAVRKREGLTWDEMLRGWLDLPA